MNEELRLWHRRVLERIDLRPEHVQAAALHPVYATPQTPFGTVTGWEHSAWIETGRRLVIEGCNGPYTLAETLHFTAYTTARGEVPSEWVIQFHTLDSSGRRWPRVPTLAHALAWAEQRFEIHQGESSPLCDAWFAARYPWVRAAQPWEPSHGSSETPVPPSRFKTQMQADL